MHLVIVFKGKGSYLGLTMPTKRGCKAVLMFFLEILWIAYFTFVVLEGYHIKDHSSLIYKPNSDENVHFRISGMKIYQAKNRHNISNTFSNLLFRSIVFKLRSDKNGTTIG